MKQTIQTTNCRVIWVTLSESFRTSIRGFSGSNHEDIFWNFPNWSTSNLRNWVSIYRQLQADCLYHVNCLYNFPAYTWRQKRNAFPGLCSGSIFMIQKNLIIILGTEPRIVCSEVICKNNSSMIQLIIQQSCSINTMVANVGSWCPTLCYHACISAMWGLVTWWPSCKLCMGSLVSLYGLSETFINTRNFVYLLQSSDVYTQLNNCLL